MNRKARLFALAEALRARRTGVTAEQLADRFGVTVRTIFRDLATLQEAGMPLVGERGRGGGYVLDKSYQLPPINLTAREAALLVALGKMAQDQRLLPFTETLASGLDKVRSALSASAQRELLRQLEQIAVVGVPTLPVAKGVQKALETAWFEDRTLEIHYAKGPYWIQPRQIRVRGLVLDRQITLINADDLETGQPRQFRLDRIARARVL